MYCGYEHGSGAFNGQSFSEFSFINMQSVGPVSLNSQ